MNAIPDVNDYVEVGSDAPEPEDWCDRHGEPCLCDGEYRRWDDNDEPDYPQGGEHYLEIEMRREREDG